VFHSRNLSSIVFVLVAAVAYGQRGREAPTGAWPFGGGRGGTGLDLYNLGLLGAKASDASKDAPKAERTSGRRSFSGQGEKSSDVGPEKLRIEVLMPDGPAEKAGLKVGDVVAGVEQAPSFSDGSLKPLATALMKAEASGGPRATVVLLVEGADGKSRKVKATFKGKKEFADPAKAATRAAWAKEACDRLVKIQTGEGSIPCDLGGKTGELTTTGVGGLAWIAMGSTTTRGPYAPALAKARNWVARNLDAKDPFASARPTGGANWNQENWGWCHAAIFLAELQLREPSAALKEDVRRCVDALVRNQEASGGWAHGPGGPNGLGYVELNIMAGLALGGLGLAKQCGIDVPNDPIRKAADYVEESSSGGGVGYSTNPGQKGMGNIGRSAGCFLGYKALGLSNRGAYGQMRDYVARNVGDIFGGHASLMQQILLAGVASAALDSSAQNRFWEEAAVSAILARSPDGSFQPRPWRESVLMSSNSDVTAGEGWTTACWAVVLAADAPDKAMYGLPGWTGARKSQ
jgi:hypothetical protein